MARFADRRDLLLSRKAELFSRLKKGDPELGSHQPRDWEDLAVERETDEVLAHLVDAGL
jgi:hypothetical protein